MVSELIDKYLWLMQKIAAASPEGITLEEIARAWERRYGSPLPRRSFCNHKEAVEDLFKLEIHCRRKDNRYYISEHSLEELDSSTKWLVNTFTVSNLLSLSREELRGRISVEDIPSGNRFLAELMQAMLSGVKVVITYTKYTGDASEEVTVHPWAVKEHARRWYLVGYAEEREGTRVYGLDRIGSLKLSADPFEMPSGYDVDAEFADSYGPYLTGEEAVEILFRSTPLEARYLEDLPIHGSQRLVRETEEGPVFSIKVVPTVNLIMEFCRHGDRLEVLSPESVRQEVIAALENSIKQYK